MYTLWINGSATEEFEDRNEALKRASQQWRLNGVESVFVVDDAGHAACYYVSHGVNFETPEGVIYCGPCVERRGLYRTIPLNGWGAGSDETPPWATCYSCRGRLYLPTYSEMSVALAIAKAGETGSHGEWAHTVLCPPYQEDRRIVRRWLEGDDFNLTDYCGY